MDKIHNDDLLIKKWRLLSVARTLLIGHRVTACHVMRIKKDVSIFRSRKFDKAFYGGLVVCGSVWACPLCSSKISERRKQELINFDFKKRFYLFAVTITLSHKNTDSLFLLHRHLTDAWRSVKSGRWYKKFKSDFGIVGCITGTEVTYGVNSGWHPHKHMLFISTSPDLDIIKARSLLADRYINSLARLGRSASKKNGLVISPVSDINIDYVAKFQKWDSIAELTKSFNKSARSADRYSPFDLLASKDDFLRGKYIEYVKTMSGSRQLTFSRHLRKLLKLGREKSDIELATEKTDEAYLLATLTPADWDVINVKKIQARVLIIARSGDIEKLNDYLTSVGCSGRYSPTRPYNKFFEDDKK